jgi:diguanylate cyclase (GGDEF)-like protein/PAS domain S-box-containing protein
MPSDPIDSHAVSAGPHPRTVGWFGTTAVAMGGINQSLFLLSALFIGQADIPGQGSAAVVLLGIGLLLSWAATPGWTELVLMYPNRVGGIAATCAEAFRPYSPVLANLTGVCYWWGWVPTCGFTALLASSAIVQWYLPMLSVPLLASFIVVFFTVINLCGVKWVMRLAMPIATLAATLAFLSAVVPIFSGSVDWKQAFTFSLVVPFDGWFGQVTSVMAGLYLIGFAAPAFEQAACHVGETIDPNKNVPRAIFASAGLASLYFIVLPIIWLGTLGPEPLGKELALELGPTFAPLFAGSAKAVAIWFMIFNMLHGTIAPLAGAARTLAQLAEDGLLPQSLAKRSTTDAPWVATLLTAGMAIVFLLMGDPLWLIAAANLTYLIGIALPSVAVWLLRRNEPSMIRPYRAPRGTIMLGLAAAAVWGLTVVLGFQQFGLPTVLVGLLFAYSGSVLYAWRKYVDRRKAGLPGIGQTLHLKLTGAMLLVLALDAAGYLLAVSQVQKENAVLIAALEDIFVVVALLTFSVGLILPGMIAHSAVEVSKAVDRLVHGTMADFTRAMRALAAGDLAHAKAKADLAPVTVFSHDEVGQMALNFNRLQAEIGRAAVALDGAREGLSKARAELLDRNDQLRVAAIAFESLEGRFVTDANFVILRVNQALIELTGYSEFDAVNRTPAFLWSNRRDALGYDEIWHAGKSRGFWHGETWARRQNGEDFPVRLTVTAVKDAWDEATHYVATLSDITVSKAAVEEIQRLGFHDALTGLPNRRLLLDRLQQALTFAQRNGRCGALMFLDLDDFKTLNDNLGHDVGDLLLQQVTRRLKDSMREGDTVARLGGDEFVVILQDLSGSRDEAIAQTELIGEKIRNKLSQRYALDKLEWSSTPSIGATVFKGTDQSTDQLLKQADIAMYQAKAAGRNTLRFFDPQMQAVVTARAALEMGLRQALEHGQFALYYQAQFRGDRQLTGVEALVRWIHPERGMVSPADFIPLAEDTALILPLGKWVLETACGQLASWASRPEMTHLTVAVNVSARQFRQDDFVDQTLSVIARTGANPKRLKLELTESLLVTNVEDVITKMELLKSHGIGFSLDDFGTGYSSLSHLKRLPLEQLKIDQGFVRDILTDPNDAAIAQMVIALGDSMGLTVMAEGVETTAQRDFLAAQGCYAYQGYLFSRPLPIDDFEAFVQQIDETFV